MRLVIALLAASALSAQAGITTKIAQVYPPDEFNPNYEVLAIYDGRVFEVSPDTPEIVETLEHAKAFDAPVEIELEDLPLIASDDFPEVIVEATLAPKLNEPVHTDGQAAQDYEPTKVESMDKAGEMFQHLYRRTRRKTECFNRAHIWNRQLDKDFGVKNEKIFIFYTRKYRRAYRRWKWWFHTAPVVRVDDQVIVLDREFTSNPVTESAWEWQFSAPNREDEGHRCRRIDEMSEYYDTYNTNNIFCNTLIAPMYYWEPSRLSDRESDGAIQNSWVNWELRQAARDVFGRWVDVFEELKVE